MIGGLAASAAVRQWPFRVYSFPGVPFESPVAAFRRLAANRFWPLMLNPPVRFIDKKIPIDAAVLADPKFEHYMASLRVPSRRELEILLFKA